MNHNSIKETSFERLENIAIIGNGGRENALAWAIQKNDHIKNIYIMPGNGGSNNLKKCQRIDIDYNDRKKLIDKLNDLNIDFIIIGPEIPLAKGLADILREKNFCVFGPGSDGAKLESSKSWAKSFMKNGNIPTADFWKISTIEDAEKIINKSTVPLVVKADGLASGKGVFIPENKNETLEITKQILNGKFGKAGNIVVLEERLQGPEVSVFALCDGKKYIVLPTAQDHKRLEEGDKGLNTGGMGAYSPTPLISKDDLIKICDYIIDPTMNELIKKEIDYRGVLYVGLMITESGPKVIEYNCRFGDPECQTIMPLMDKDFVNLLYKCAMGNLCGNETITSNNKVSGCVITTSKGYPLDYEVGYQIQLEDIEDEYLQIFHSGTTINESGELVTNGGRVLSIVCQEKDFDSVFKKIYEYLNKIKFKGIFYRKDIGHQVRESFNGEQING